MSGRKEEHDKQKIRVNKASFPSLEFSKSYLTGEAKIIPLSVVILDVCVGVIEGIYMITVGQQKELQGGNVFMSLKQKNNGSAGL